MLTKTTNDPQFDQPRKLEEEQLTLAKPTFHDRNHFASLYAAEHIASYGNLKLPIIKPSILNARVQQ